MGPLKIKNETFYTLEHLKWNAFRRSTRCLNTDKSIEKHGDSKNHRSNSNVHRCKSLLV